MLFIFAALPILLYSFGYRLSLNDFKLVRAGGLAISSIPATGVKISVDGKFVHETSLISRRAYLQGLTPRVYHIHIEKDGFYPWDKAVGVLPEKVTSAEALLVKKGGPEILLKGKFTDMAFYDGSEELLSLSEGKKIRTIFSLEEKMELKERPPRAESATSSQSIPVEIKTLLAEKKPDGFDYDEPSRILWWKGSTLWVRWLEGEDYLPLYTEEAESEIVTTASPIKRAFFYPNREAIILAVSDSVLVVELDGRVWRNKQELYLGTAPNVLVSKSKKEAYVLDIGKLYLIPLL